MRERRRFVRLETRVEVDCTVLPSETAHRIVSKDLGGGGFRLWTERSLQPGTPLQLAIRLPSREEPVNAAAEVMWSEQVQVTGKTGHYRGVEIGARCVEIAPKDYDALVQFVSSSLRPATNLVL